MPEPPELLRASLAGRYDIERELGEGGMATVYLAEDVRHGRKVAIKVIRPEVGSSLGIERFLAEIRTTASLQHPHILGLIDSGVVASEGGGARPFYVMPFVTGETLRARLVRERALPVSDAVTILIEVADALACAHGHGVVHRDVKPENILLGQGHAMVMDFGIAKAVHRSSAGASLTSTGASIGTPAYMAPEQAVGDPTIDHRADLYALGIVAYEMVAGRPPFVGASVAAMVAASLTQPAPSLSATVPKCPPRLSALVADLLEKDPGKRPDSAAVVRDTLRLLLAEISTSGPSAPPPARRSVRLAVAVAIVVAVGGAIALSRPLRRPLQTPDSTPPASAMPRSIAVLPFENINRDSATDYFSDGMTEELISALGRLRGLRVASRTSTFAMKGNIGALSDIGQRLGVDAVVEASVQHDADQVRVTARLVDVRRDSALWDGEYTGQLRNVLYVQDSLARAIVTALGTVLGTNAGAALARPRTANPQAYDAYVRGRAFLGQRSPASMASAVTSFETAIRLDSTFAPAYAGLADAYSLLAPFGARRPREVFPLARSAAEHALRLDSTLAEAHTSLGIVSLFFDWDGAAARTHLKRAVELNASSAEGHLFYAWYLILHGRQQDALAEMSRADSLDQLSVVIPTRHANILEYEGRYAEAIPLLRRALARDSNFAFARASLAESLLQLGQREEARRVAPRGALLLGSGEGSYRGWILAQVGDTTGAREELRSLEAARQQRYVSLDAIAGIYAALGDSLRALDLLEQAAEERAFTLPFIAYYPPFQPLHGNPRFRRLVERIGVVLR
jgi:serine/threonine-protein kinase